MKEPRSQSQPGHLRSWIFIPDTLTFPHFAQILHIIIATLMTLPYKHSLRASDLLNLGTVPSAKHICGKIGFRHGDANEAIQLYSEIALPIVTAAI